MNQAILDKISQALTTLDQRSQYLVTAAINTRRRVARMEAERALEKRHRAPRLPLEFRSQYGEDILLWDLLGGLDCPLDGFFLECGAADGRSLSVSYVFEALGWSGILVEPFPEAHAQCVAARPNSNVTHAAVSRRGSAGQATFTVACGIEQLSYLTTTPAHRDRVTAETRETRTISVPLSTLADILRSAGAAAKTIDFAVIDVEGAEIDVLDGLELERFGPRILVVEDNAPGASAGDTPSLIEYMRTQPYRHVGSLWINQVYVHQRETAILARARETQF